MRCRVLDPLNPSTPLSRLGLNESGNSPTAPEFNHGTPNSSPLLRPSGLPLYRVNDTCHGNLTMMPPSVPTPDPERIPVPPAPVQSTNRVLGSAHGSHGALGPGQGTKNVVLGRAYRLRGSADRFVAAGLSSWCFPAMPCVLPMAMLGIRHDAQLRSH